MILRATVVAVWMLTLGFDAFLTHAQESEASVMGTVVDTFQAARITDAKVTLLGSGHKYETTTTSSGEYLLKLEPGVYEIRVTRPGFCDGGRAAFALKAGTKVTFDFELLLCGSVDPIRLHPEDGNGTTSSSPDRYQREELNPVSPNFLRPVIFFGDRQETGDGVRYSALTLLDRHFPVVYTYNLLTIKSDTLIYSKTDNSVRATGNVSFDDGINTKRGSKLDLTFRDGKPYFDLAK
jgi:hypothetical protein